MNDFDLEQLILDRETERTQKIYNVAKSLYESITGHGTPIIGTIEWHEKIDIARKQWEDLLK